MNISFQHVEAVNELFKRLNSLRRWTSIRTTASFDELSKQSLNGIVSYMLASYCEEAGLEIKWSNFPKIALYRSFAKAYIYFDTPEYIIEELCKLGNITKEAFEVAIQDTITEEAGPEFADFLCESLHTYEQRIFKAARQITTFVELHENEVIIGKSDYCIKVQEMVKKLEMFNDIPGVRELTDIDGPLFKILLKLASLRNQNRWAFLSYPTECSVLGHLFDTAGFAYLMSLELNPDDEETATANFFTGVFHDIPEAWTTDFQGPLKDKIPGLRKVTEEFELLMLEKHLYSNVPKFLAEKLRKVMLEDESNEQVKPLIKGADYLSADSECWRQLVGGSNDRSFLKVIRDDGEKFNTDKVLMTPMCEQLYWNMRKFAEIVMSKFM